MPVERQPPHWPRTDPEIAEAIQASLRDESWGLYRGEHLPALEAELAAFHRVPHVLTCSSGTLAVEVALRALRVNPGDEVILAAYEYESNFLTIHAIGAKPVLVDVLPHNWNLDPARIEAAITEKTRAILCSHLHGGIVPMREVVAIAAARGIGVVEDAAQAAGAMVQGKPAGTWGDVGTLSFGGSKLLSAGRGGALLFRDAAIHQRARVHLHRGVQPWAPLSELQAIVLRPQLARLPAMTALRSERVNRIASPALRPFENRLPECEAAFYKVGYECVADRAAFVAAMRAAGVAFDVGFAALHVGRSPSRFRASGELANATAAHERCVILHHPVLTASEAEFERSRSVIAAFAS